MASTLTITPLTGVESKARREPAPADITRSQAGLGRMFIAAALLFLLVVALLLHFIIRDSTPAIAQFETESTGLPYLPHLGALSAALSAHRHTAETIREQMRGAPDAFSESEMAMQRAITDIGQLNTQAGAQLGIVDAWQKFSVQWKAIQGQTAAHRLPASRSYDDANRALQQFVLMLKDRSRLILDDELDSNYLIESSTETVPALFDVLAQPAVSVAALDRLAGRLQRDMDHAFAVDNTLRDDLEGPLNQALAQLAGVYTATQGEAGKSAAARNALLAFNSAVSARLEVLMATRTQDLKRRQWIEIGISLGLVLVALILLGAAARSAMNAARAREEQAARLEAEGKRNQTAILQLLNEMAELATGNLNVRAQVTENMTGALADSINFTIEELHDLVVQVNKATGQVTQHVEQTKTISTDLFQAAQKQYHDITNTSALVLNVAKSIREVSTTAEESAGVARRSLAAAEKGATAVGNSIGNMNDIRELIQETAKQIKRLGESSQEIGEIVELISDITEQTNVLALNASIQAASAGEAGRGFAIVAEEIQRLAERSGQATKQIGGLVRRIQHDTQEAVASMEKSTQGVVEGAKLSDAAGDALNEIREVSGQLAELIQKISDATRTQSTLAGKMLQNVKTILAVTEKTSKDTQRTNESIEYLAALATDLRQSVSGFKL